MIPFARVNIVRDNSLHTASMMDNYSYDIFKVATVC